VIIRHTGLTLNEIYNILDWTLYYLDQHSTFMHYLSSRTTSVCKRFVNWISLGWENAHLR